MHGTDEEARLIGHRRITQLNQSEGAKDGIINQNQKPRRVRLRAAYSGHSNNNSPQHPHSIGGTSSQNYKPSTNIAMPTAYDYRTFVHECFAGVGLGVGHVKWQLRNMFSSIVSSLGDKTPFDQIGKDDQTGTLHVVGVGFGRTGTVSCNPV